MNIADQILQLEQKQKEREKSESDIYKDLEKSLLINRQLFDLLEKILLNL